jgi:hypothetical protein
LLQRRVCEPSVPQGFARAESRFKISAGGGVRAIIHHVLDLDLDNWQQDIGAEATNPASKTWLQKCLTAQRALKADYLRGHPTVLRKSTKVTGDPAPKGLRVMTPDLSDMRSAPSPSC